MPFFSFSWLRVIMPLRFRHFFAYAIVMPLFLSGCALRAALIRCFDNVAMPQYVTKKALRASA